MVNYLVHEIETISSQMPEFWNKIELDIQVVDGSFSVVNTEGTFRRQTVYQSIQNVVAKLRTYNNSTESILINCHFDSVFTSPGMTVFITIYGTLPYRYNSATDGDD